MNDITVIASAKRAHKLRKLKENVVGYLFISSVLLGILIFTVFPVIYAFITSFFDYSNISFVMENFGFQNYIRPFTTDWPSFSKSLIVTFTYAIVNIPLTLILSFALALFLNQKLKGIRFFRTLFYLPVLIPAVCSGLLWKLILHYDSGFLNGILETIGLEPVYWLNNPSTAIYQFIMLGLFNIGGGMILWLAQLKNVPASMYESAKLDGATRVSQLFYITIPMCTPMIFYNMITSLIGTLQTFATVQTLVGTGLGQGDGLMFYVIHIYEVAFVQNELGYASALSFILMLIIGLLTVAVFKTNKWVYYGEEA